MFYAAEDKDTALAEVGVYDHPYATVGSWQPTRPFTFLDLVELPMVPSLFDHVESHRRTWLIFLQQFAGQVARPVTANAGPVDYVPTQVFTEFLRDVPLHDDGSRIEAIRYRSSLDPDGACWVVFAGPEECSDGTDGLLRLENDSVALFELDWQPFDATRVRRPG